MLAQYGQHAIGFRNMITKEIYKEYNNSNCFHCKKVIQPTDSVYALCKTILSNKLEQKHTTFDVRGRIIMREQKITLNFHTMCFESICGESYTIANDASRDDEIINFKQIVTPLKQMEYITIDYGGLDTFRDYLKDGEKNDK